MISNQHDDDLTNVISILKDMSNELDGDLYICKNCGRNSWKNLKEGRVASEILAMLRKGRKCQLMIREFLSEGEES